MNKPRYIAANILKYFFRYIFLTIWLIIIIIPIYWIITSSFKPLHQAYHLGFPTQFDFQNYIIPFVKLRYWKLFINSSLFALVSTFSNLLFSAFAAYGFSKYRFFARNTLFIIILSTMMISVHVIMVPLFLLTNSLRLIDTFPGLLLPFLVTAFGIFMIRQNLKSVPDEYINAARIDGASEIRIFFTIILPLLKPVLATLGVLNFIAVWDEFLWPLIVANSENTRTLTVGIGMFFSSYQVPINQVFAVCTAAMIPLMIAFAFAQKYFIESLTITGLKQ